MTLCKDALWALGFASNMQDAFKEKGYFDEETILGLFCSKSLTSGEQQSLLAPQLVAGSGNAILPPRPSNNVHPSETSATIRPPIYDSSLSYWTIPLPSILRTLANGILDGFCKDVAIFGGNSSSSISGKERRGRNSISQETEFLASFPTS